MPAKDAMPIYWFVHVSFKIPLKYPGNMREKLVLLELAEGLVSYCREEIYLIIYIKRTCCAF